MTTFRTIPNIFAVLLAVFLAYAPAAAAQAPETSTNDPLQIYRATGTDNQQDEKMNALMREFQTLTLAKGEVMVRLMKEMRALSLQPEATPDAALAKQAEINALNNEMALERVKFIYRLRSVLTQEQRQKLVKAISKVTASAN